MKKPFQKTTILAVASAALGIAVSAATGWWALHPIQEPQRVRQGKDEKARLGDAFFNAAMDRIHDLDRQEKARRQAAPDTALFQRISFNTLEDRQGGKVLGTLDSPAEAIVFHDGSTFGVRSLLPPGTLLTGTALFNPDQVGGKNIVILNGCKFPDGTTRHIRASLHMTNGKLDL